MKKSYTFIETIVVVAVLALVVPTIFTIVFTVLSNQMKTIRLTVAKRDGDRALNLISTTIKNEALTIYQTTPIIDTNQVCDAFPSSFGPVSTLYFVDDKGTWFRYTLASNQISSASATVAAYNLTSNDTYVQNLSLSCLKNVGFGPPLITVSFDICFKTPAMTCATSRPEEVANLHYETKIRIRNF